MQVVAAGQTATGALVPLKVLPDGSLVVQGAGGAGVTSVFGRTGAVVAAAGDYTAAQVSNPSSAPGATTADALTNIHNKPDFATEFNAGNSGAALNVDYNNGPAQRLTLTANCTATIIGLTGTNTRWLQLRAIQGGVGNFKLTIATALTPGGLGVLLSVAVGASDIINLFWNGTALYASVAGLDFK